MSKLKFPLKKSFILRDRIERQGTDLYKKKIEGKADRTAKGWKFTNLFAQKFRLDKTSLHQGLEKLSENRINGRSDLK